MCGPKPTQPLQPGVAPCLATTLVVKCPDGPWSCCVTIVAFKFSALLQGSPRTFFNSLITNLSSGGTRCNELAFWTPFSVRTMCSSVIEAPPLIQIACWHGCVRVHHSFSEWQYLARVRFPKNTHKRSSPVVFHLKSRQAYAACRINHAIRMLSLGSFSCRRFSSDNHNARQTQFDHSVRGFNLALTLMAGSRAMSHQRSLDPSALHSLQQLYQHRFLI